MNKELIEKCNALAQRVETPSSNWSADGKPDPHGKTYECERAGLHMGNMTDDELANGAFLNYDQPLNVAGILAGTCHSPIAWMTAVKDRIRWLSRSLEKAVAERANLEAYLRTIGEPENTFPLNPNGASKWARLQKHDGAEAIGVVFRTGSGSVGSLVDGRVVWADWLAHPNGSKPESVNAELLEALKYARRFMNKSAHDTDYLDAAIARAESAIEGSPKPVSPDLLESARAVVARWDAPTWKDLPATAEYIGRLRVAIAQADLDGALTAEEWVVKNVSGSAGLVRAMVIRAEAEESAIETPAKVSPCAGHAVQHEVSGGTPGCGSE